MRARFTEKGRKRQLAVDAYWRENRPDAPNLFDDELLAALDQLEVMPYSGHFFENVDGIQMRRVLLKKSKQHVYYEVDTQADEVVIYSIWGTARGRPKL